MTDQEYLDYIDMPLSEEEKELLRNKGWEFARDDYIFIPDDYDGSMACGIRSIRKVLLSYQCRELYIMHQGRCKDILESLESLKFKGK